MAERSPDKLPPEAVSSGTNSAQAADVFTLHHTVLSRWDGGRALGAAHSSASAALTHGHDRWLGGLAGLSTLGGGFGPSAWNMAAQLVAEPTLLTRLGADLRSLQVGELADLVQLILEEEEGQGDIADLEAAVEAETARVRSGTSAKASTPKSSASKAKSSGTAAKSSAAKGQARRAPLHLQNKLKELRRVLAEVRRADTTGVSMPQSRGDVGGDNPLQSIAAPSRRDGSARTAEGAALAEAAVASQSPVAALPLSSSIQRVAAAGRQPSMQRTAWASPFSSVAQAQTSAAAPRALRMAEQAAELALLDLPAAEFGAADTGSAGITESADRSRVSAPQARNSSPQASSGQASPLAGRAVAAGGQAFTRAETQAQSFAALRHQWSAQQTAQQLNVAAQRVNASSRSNLPTLPTPSTQPTQVSGQLPSSGQTRASQTVSGSSSSAAPRSFAGMTAAVGHARAHLQRLDQGLAKMAVHQLATAADSRSAPAQAMATSPANSAMPVPAAQASGSVSRRALANQASGSGIGDLGAQQELASAPLQRWQAWSELATEAFRGVRAGRTYRGSLASGGDDREILGLAEEVVAAAESLDARAAGAVDGKGRAPGVASPAAAARTLAGRVQSSAARSSAAQSSQDQQSPRNSSSAQLVARRLATVPTASARDASSGQLPSWIAPQAHSASMAAAESRRSAGGAATSAASASPVVSQSAPGAVASSGAVSASSRLVERIAQQWAKATGGVPGLSAAAVSGFAERFVGRSLLGLEPSADHADAAVAGSAQASWSLRSSSALDTRPLGLAQALASKRSAHGSADAQREAPGEWLVPGAEAEAAAFGDAPRADAATVSRGSVAGERSAGSRPAARASAAMAAVAAVERAQRQAVAALRTVASASPGGSSVLQSVSGVAELGVLAAAPGGQADALTPWLAKRLSAGTAVSKAAATDGAGELLSLGEDGSPLSSVDGGSAVANSPTANRNTARGNAERGSATGTPSRTSVAADGRRAGRATSAVSSRVGPQVAGSQGAGERNPRSGRSASAAVDSLTPQALRTILQALGEPTAAAERDIASAFAAKWLGRSDVAGKVLRRMASDATPAGELLAMRDTADGNAEAPSAFSRSAAVQPAGKAAATKPGLAASAPTQSRAGTPIPAAVDGDNLVLSGFAALAALASGDFGQRPAPRPMNSPEVERTMLAPAAEAAGTVSTGGAAEESSARSVKSSAPKADSLKLAAVKLHEFAPLGLKRGRNLLGQQRRSNWLHTTPRGQAAAARSLSRVAGSRVGYGAAALGAGDLLGLVQGDAEMFFGDGAPSPSAVRGADRLSQAVMARRGHTHRASPSAAPMAAFEGEQVMPSDFRAGGDPAAAMQASMAASGRSGGATAGIKATQAAAMTRVLSVTSAPASNVLPLVAPAAQAVVAAAAAKPLSESIVTSGADPTVGMPMAGVGGHKAGKAGGGAEKERAAAEEHGSNVQDLEALAMKVARSVMVRIKRERERRGLHV